MTTYFEASICRESDSKPWQAFIQITNDDGDMIGNAIFDVDDIDLAHNEMCAYFLTHTPPTISAIVNNHVVRNEIREAVYAAWKRNNVEDLLESQRPFV